MNVPLPSLPLITVDNGELALDEVGAGWLVIYCYPGIGSPSGSAQAHRADATEHRAYRAAEEAFARAGVRIVGLSSQSRAAQLHDTFAYEVRHHLLRDPGCRLAQYLSLPMLRIEGEHYYERMTLLAYAGFIQHVIHPVTSPAGNPLQVRAWLGSCGW